MGGSEMAQEQGGHNWVADQREVLDEAEAILAQAFDEARAKLSTIREVDELGFSRCLRCSCEFFVSRNPDTIPGAEAPLMACMRIGCRHLFASHKFF